MAAAQLSAWHSAARAEATILLQAYSVAEPSSDSVVGEILGAPPTADVHDLVTLSDVSPALVLHTLRLRYAAPHTHTAAACTSCSPCCSWARSPTNGGDRRHSSTRTRRP